MGEKERALFAKVNKEMGDIMDWTRPLTLKEQQQIMAEVREKNRRDRLDRDEYVFEQGKAEGMEKGKVAGIAEGMEKERQAMVLSMLKAKADIVFISNITGLSTDEINKLKNGK